MRLRVGGAALVALLLVATGCESGSGTSTTAAPISFEQLAASATTSADA